MDIFYLGSDLDERCVGLLGDGAELDSRNYPKGIMVTD